MVLPARPSQEQPFRPTRLESLTGSRVWALVVASMFFGVYHLPYAYYNPNWPSAGNWGAAWSAALGQGIPAGLILGGLSLHTKKNLVACILLRTLTDALPFMGMIRFGGQWPPSKNRRETEPPHLRSVTPSLRHSAGRWQASSPQVPTDPSRQVSTRCC
jgi:hypothetical protein